MGSYYRLLCAGEIKEKLKTISLNSVLKMLREHKTRAWRLRKCCCNSGDLACGRERQWGLRRKDKSKIKKNQTF